METQISPVEQAYEKLRNYTGTNSFIASLKQSLARYNSLTERQLPHLLKFFDEGTSNAPTQGNVAPSKTYPTFVLKNPVVIQVRGKYFVKSLCEEKLKLGSVKSYAWLVKEVTGETPKAIRVKAEIPDNKHTLTFCRNCGRNLTDKFSIATGMGKVCANNYGVPYIKDLSQVEDFKAQLDEVIKKIGVQEFWLPKSMVKEEYLETLLNEIQNSKI